MDKKERICAFCGCVAHEDTMIEKKGKFYCDIFCWRNWDVPRKGVVVPFKW